MSKVKKSDRSSSAFVLSEIYGKQFFRPMEEYLILFSKVCEIKVAVEKQYTIFFLLAYFKLSNIFRMLNHDLAFLLLLFRVSKSAPY